MSKRKDQIIQKAIEILKENAQGVRYSQLVKMIKEDLPPEISVITPIIK
jgi:hypothetical protein